MPNLMKMKYMDEPYLTFDEWFCKTDSARESLVQAGIIKPGDRCVMKSGDIYLCWDESRGFEKIITGGSSQHIDFNFKGEVATYDELPSSAEVGDMYLVEDTQEVYFWDGDGWQEIELPEAIYSFSFEGTISDPELLPSVGNENGDMYQIEGTSTIYIWSGVEWIEVTLDQPLYVLTKKGIVDSQSQLPQSNNNQGDIYELNGRSKVFIWTGEEWATINLTSPISTDTVEEKFINFYDYRGTLLYSYSKEEINNLSQMPPLPVREGYISQRWNWSLLKLKQMTNRTDVGVVYKSEAMGLPSKATVIDFDIKNENLPNFFLYIYLESGKITVSIDSKYSLNYDVPGLIKIDASNYLCDIGKHILKIGPGEFGTSPSYTIGYTDPNNHKVYGFLGDPNNTSLQIYRNTVESVHAGKELTIGEDAFRNFYNLEYVTFDPDVAGIGQRSFQNCLSLNNVGIPDNSNGFAFGASCFYNCSSLDRLFTPYKISELGTDCFYGCTALKSLNEYDTSLCQTTNWFCKSCRSLQGTLDVSENISVIRSAAFYGCSSVNEIVFFGDITKIEANAFRECYSLQIYDFTNCTSVPVLQDISGIQENTGMIIYVPDSLLNEWKNATNWDVLSSYIQVKL